MMTSLLKIITTGLTLTVFAATAMAAQPSAQVTSQSKFASQVNARRSSPPSGTAAKPAKDPWGCTTADLNTPGASACVDLEENDITKNTGYFHVVVCSADGSKQCCSGSEKTGKIDFCRPVSLTSNPTKGLTAPSGTLQNVPADKPPPKTPPAGSVPQSGGTLQRK